MPLASQFLYSLYSQSFSLFLVGLYCTPSALRLCQHTLQVNYLPYVGNLYTRALFFPVACSKPLSTIAFT